MYLVYKSEEKFWLSLKTSMYLVYKSEEKFWLSLKTSMYTTIWK